MYAQLSDSYRMEGRSLYQKHGSAFVHVAVVPARIRGLAPAVAWFERSADE